MVLRWNIELRLVRRHRRREKRGDPELAAALLAIPVGLAARWLSVAVP